MCLPVPAASGRPDIRKEVIHFMEAAKQPVERKSLDERHRAGDLDRLRHSASHIMADAVLRLWPDAKIDIGPATHEGFY